MARYRTYSIEFELQVGREYLGGGVPLLGSAKRHTIYRNLIRLRLKKCQGGEFNEDAASAASMEEYEAKIATLERKVGELTMENDALK